MKKNQVMVMGLAALCAMALAGEASARGGRGGGSVTGSGTMASTQNHVRTQTTTTRPEGSQRRDGTFLTTGTTANGATTRPSNGTGLQDGSCLTGTTAAAAAVATVAP